MPTSARLLCIYKIRIILPLQTNSLAAVQAEMLHTASMVANGRMWDSEPTGAKPPSRPSTSYGDPSVQKRQPGVWPPYGKICSPNAGGRMWE